MSEIAVTKIVLKIGKKEIELTPEQAQELHAVLKELLDKNSYPIYIPQPYPVIVEKPPYRTWITYGDNTGTYSITSNG